MADLGKLINDKTAADTQWREQRQAEREAAAALRDESVVEITTSPEAYARYLDMQGDKQRRQHRPDAEAGPRGQHHLLYP